MNLRLSLYAALAGAVCLVQPFRPYVVDGASMSPTLASGQIVLGNARPRQIARGDVVVFRRGSETMIKRVAYLPGDRIERYLFKGEWKVPTNGLMRASMVRQGYPRRDLVVPPDGLYVIGDNFRDSVDSRTYGAIETSEVMAVVVRSPACREPWSVPSHETLRTVARL